MKVAVRYFSGTGNTAWLADRFKESLEARGAAVSMGAIGLDGDPCIVQESLTLVVLYPVYALDAPDTVKNFVRHLPPGMGRCAAVVRSPGDPLFNGGATLPLRKELERRGWRVIHETMIVMPPNIFYRASDDLAALLLAAARRRIAATADTLLGGGGTLTGDVFATRCAGWIFSRLLKHFSFLFGRDLRATKQCNRCGLCVRECPAHTIEMTLGGLRFGNGCLLCLRCVTRCPKKAIVPRFFKLFPIWPPYDLETLDRTGTKGKKPRNWFERFYRRYLDTV